MIALATVVLGVLLFTIYVGAYGADDRGDDKETYRLLAWTTPPWFLTTVLNAVQADVLFVVINIAMTFTGFWFYAKYRAVVDAEKAAAAGVDEPVDEIADVLASHGGDS